MTKSLIFLFIIIGQIAFAQQVVNLRPELKTIVDEMANDNLYKSASIGYGAAKTEQWKRFLALKKVTTDKELISLMNHESPAVRAYAFEALVERKNPETFDLLLAHLDDNEEIQSFKGMNVKKQLMGDFLLEMYALDGVEKKAVDSILFYNPNIRLVAKSQLLEGMKPQAEKYDRLREMVVDDQDPSALIALAKFQRKKDISLIISWLKGNEGRQYSGLRAVRYFPSIAFFPYLKKIQQEELKKEGMPNLALTRILYLATVQYKDQKSHDFLEYSLRNAKGNSRKNHQKFIWLAVSKYPDQIYFDIQKSIHLTDFEKKTLGYWMEVRD